MDRPCHTPTAANLIPDGETDGVRNVSHPRYGLFRRCAVVRTGISAEWPESSQIPDTRGSWCLERETRPWLSSVVPLVPALSRWF